MNRFRNIIIGLHTQNKKELHNLYTTKHFSGKAAAYHQAEMKAKIYYYLSFQFSFTAINYREPEKLVLEIFFSPNDLGLNFSPNDTLPVEDYLLRVISPIVNELSESYTNDKKDSREKSSFKAQMASEIIINRNGIYYSPESEKFCLKVYFDVPLINHTSINGKSAARAVKELLDTINNVIMKINKNECRSFIETFGKQQYIRQYLRQNDFVSFVADGSILPRLNGTSAPMKNAVPFKSPQEFEISIELPGGLEIKGMGIKKGVTVITGGGYSGKSTLLDAIEMGIYNHTPGDGREFVITDERALKIYAEDGRPVKNLDMSPFYKYFPNDTDVKNFSTHHASGSVSQAANIIEAVYAGVKLLLIDEDKSAVNFMIRDKNMRLVVEKEPIIPFTDRIKELSEKKDISTILVIGGSSEYLSYADTVILMEDYNSRDVTAYVKTLELPDIEYADSAASWTESRIYKPIKTNKEFIYFRTVTTENQKKIILDEYSADITLLTALITSEQLNHIASIMENLIGSKTCDNVELIRFINDVLKNKREWRQDLLTSYNFKAERWFEGIRDIDVFCTISRLRGIDIL